ncbi:MAG: DNA polymerase IV, partial [Acidimicrobiia bacterium]|nr:DNA polymerase IV [Acidimicrobiia bacterium]
ELLRNPELRGQPVVVGGRGARGVVAAASYEARAYGVHSAMPSTQAQRLCPEAVFLSGDHALYAEVSARIMAIFGDFTPLVEPLSLDEAFLDVAGVLRVHGSAPAIARRIRQRVVDEEALTCSVGVSSVKFLAKLASEAAKPSATPSGPAFGAGVHVIEPGQELAFLHPLPVRALWGVGPKTLAKLERLGISTVGDLAELPEAAAINALGDASGRHLWRLSHAIDERSVEPDQAAKSISHEETFAHDRYEPEDLGRELVRMGDAVAARLRDHELAARTISIKVRFGDFRTLTRSTTMDFPVETAGEIVPAARRLLDTLDVSVGVRLLGVAASGLVVGGNRQMSFDDLRGPSWDDATSAVDEIRARYGSDAIGPASLCDAGRVRVKRRGDQQWGPDG